MKIKDLIKLLRITQWYKNFMIFLPLIFSLHLFKITDIKITLIGFLVLCFASSSSYIINDLKDRKKDKNHPEKKSRPLASGKIKPLTALLISISLLLISLIIATKLSNIFFILVLALYINTIFFYTFLLKNEPIIDLILISINYIIRTVSGAIIINVELSPWLILCTFFLGLFLASCKRTADFFLLDKKAGSYKIVYKKYNKDILKFIMTISTSLLILSYSLYCFFSQYLYLMFSLPFAIYTIFHFTNLVFNGSIIPRKLEMGIYDNRLLLSVLLWVWSVFIILY